MLRLWILLENSYSRYLISPVSNLAIIKFYKCIHRFVIISLLSACTWRKEQGETLSRFVISLFATCLFINLMPNRCFKCVSWVKSINNTRWLKVTFHRLPAKFAGVYWFFFLLGSRIIFPNSLPALTDCRAQNILETKVIIHLDYSTMPFFQTEFLSKCSKVVI